MPEITAMMRAPDHKKFPRMRRSIFTLFSAWTGSAPACEEKLRRVWRPCETWPPTDYFTSLKPAAFITSSICAIVIPFLASSAETLIPEIPCRALKSTFFHIDSHVFPARRYRYRLIFSSTPAMFLYLALNGSSVLAASSLVVAPMEAN